MLRYFQFQFKFDNTIDYTPHYSENPEIGVVIGTYGSVPYVDLQLHYLKNVNGFNKILVHDDCSDKQEELKALCKAYNVDFYTTERQQFNFNGIGSVGDLHAFYQGLLWAKQNNIEFLIKFTEDFIPCFEWKSNLINLIKESSGITYSIYLDNENYNISFNSDVICFYVPAWSSNYPLQCMLFTIQNEMPVCANIWLHELSKTLSGNNYANKWISYYTNNKINYLRSRVCLLVKYIN